jgi:hypothetical protein
MSLYVLKMRSETEDIIIEPALMKMESTLNKAVV